MTLDFALRDLSRLAVMGLAKNSGKTETLISLIDTLAAQELRVGVTSIGRDGEENDVLDPRLKKPRIKMPAGSLVATTTDLIERGSAKVDIIAKVNIYTPLGWVVIAELQHPGYLEVAGPSGGEETSFVCSKMLEYGAKHVLIDGAFDRRCAAAPSVSEALVLSTGAVVGADIDEVVSRTVEAAKLIHLPQTNDQVIQLAMQIPDANFLVTQTGSTIPLTADIGLTWTSADLARLFRKYTDTSMVVMRGAVCEDFLFSFLRARRVLNPQIVVSDFTKLFFQEHGLSWFQKQELHLEVLKSVDLRAITINPTAPERESLDSDRLQERLSAALQFSVPVIDVLKDKARLGSI
jgi:hypothetical protein